MSDIVERLRTHDPSRWLVADTDTGTLVREAADEIERLRAALEACRRGHSVVDGDCWFSCPASGGCCDEDAGTKCNCGADEFNARIDAALEGRP